ncbi:hypothetical protein [Microtetraspora malaysiensis]|uniref:Uncharacterized protein n=1 Tax=Microtetraspora malaysiensis TaxID=161358 RepID=A0ABW6SKL8_9ACTN
MPNQPKTPSRSVRVDDPEWEAAEPATRRYDSDRTKVVKQFFDWYFHKPGVELERPPLTDLAEIIGEEAREVEKAVLSEPRPKEREKLERRSRALADMLAKIEERQRGGV